jgi:4-hydroxy-3-methylbut-2-enyl diphosphate reductase
MGVRRAMNAALEAAHKSDKTVYTLGPLVHNRQAIEMLGAKKVQVVKRGEEAEEGLLLIRAHGVTPEVKEGLERPGLEVRDMTCPHVRRAQLIIQRHAKEGFSTVIIGDAGHAEVVGLLGHAEDRGFVVAGREDLEALPELEKVCVVAQTTQNARRFEELIPLIRERYPGAVIHNTVCSATDDRQAEVRELACEVEAIIVVGGRHSANTVRLAEIARAEGVPTFHIETADELDAARLADFHTVGVTAGASTPHWVFRAVVDEANRCLEPRSALVRLPRALLTFGVHTYLYIGAGSAAMTYAALRLLEIPPRFNYLFLSFMYVVSMHLLNRFTDQGAALLNDPLRMRLLKRYSPVFMGIAVLFAMADLVIAFQLGIYPFVLMLLSLVAGIGYSLRMIPLWLTRRIGIKAVREIPGSKDIFVSLAWATVTVLLPYLAETNVGVLTALSVFLFCFIMVFIRSLVFDLKDIEGDRIVGKETVPLVMGLAATRRVIVLCTALLAAIALLDLVVTWSAMGGYLLLPVVLYVGFYLYLTFRRIIAQGLLFELAVDFQFILTGLIAFCIPYGIG